MLIDWLAFYCVYYVEMNATEPCVSSKKRTAADLLECEELFADEDVEHDNESDISDEADSQSESELSVSESEDEDSENLHTEELRDKACAAHNLQLFIKDGLKLSDEYTSLLNRVSENIVS
jgi:hypothetical protein